MLNWLLIFRSYLRTLAIFLPKVRFLTETRHKPGSQSNLSVKFLLRNWEPPAVSMFLASREQSTFALCCPGCEPFNKGLFRRWTSARWTSAAWLYWSVYEKYRCFVRCVSSWNLVLWDKPRKDCWNLEARLTFAWVFEVASDQHPVAPALFQLEWHISLKIHTD